MQIKLSVYSADASTPVVFVINRNLLVYVHVVTCKFSIYYVLFIFLIFLPNNEPTDIYNYCMVHLTNGCQNCVGVCGASLIVTLASARGIM